MVKIFVGNIGDGVSSDDLRGLFSQHGNVRECDVIGTYAFVHMDDEQEAENAIKTLDKHTINGTTINVERSKGGGGRGGSRGGRGFGRVGGGPPRGGWQGGGPGSYQGGFGGMHDNSASAKAARRAGCKKLHVASLPEQCHSDELRIMFERYGYVAECDVVEDRKIAFVHIEEAAVDAAISGLNGYIYKGVPLKVQLSKNQDNPNIPMGMNSPSFGGDYGRGRGFMAMRGGRGGMVPRGGGRPSEMPANGRGSYGDTGANYGYGQDQYDNSGVPQPPKDRMEMMEILDRRRRLDALDPYERRLIACKDPNNLPPPTPEYLRLLRERALVRARFPLASATTAMGRSLPTAGATTTSSALARALIARRAAASSAKPEMMPNAVAGMQSYGEPQSMPAMPYADAYSTQYTANY